MKDISIFKNIMETEDGYRFETGKNRPTFVYRLIDRAWVKIGNMPRHYKTVEAAYRAAQKAGLI